MLQNDVIKCCKMMSSNVLLHSNNCCIVLEPAICEDLDLHVAIFVIAMAMEKWVSFQQVKVFTLQQQRHRKIFVKKLSSHHSVNEP